VPLKLSPLRLCTDTPWSFHSFAKDDEFKGKFAYCFHSEHYILSCKDLWTCPRFVISTDKMMKLTLLFVIGSITTCALVTMAAEKPGKHHIFMNLLYLVIFSGYSDHVLKYLVQGIRVNVLSMVFLVSVSMHRLKR